MVRPSGPELPNPTTARGEGQLLVSLVGSDGGSKVQKRLALVVVPSGRMGILQTELSRVLDTKEGKKTVSNNVPSGREGQEDKHCNVKEHLVWTENDTVRADSVVDELVQLALGGVAPHPSRLVLESRLTLIGEV